MQSSKLGGGGEGGDERNKETTVLPGWRERQGYLLPAIKQARIETVSTAG